MKKKTNDTLDKPIKKRPIDYTTGRPPIYSSVEELEELIDNYFLYCKEYNKPYTMSGLALFLGMDRRTLLNYSYKKEFLPPIKRAKDRVENYLEEMMLNKDKPTGIIFAMKNNFGWVDKQEITQDINAKVDSVNINVNLTEDE